VLESVNNLLLELGQPEMFVTLFYGVIDPALQTLSYSRAGHDRPVLLRGGEVRLLDGDGTPLGILTEPEFRLTEESLDLQPGDRLVLYTDGLYDVVSPQGEMFDRRRLFRLLVDHAQLPAKELCEALFADLLAFQGTMEQFDDMSLVVVEVEE
jgi:sigma-B regulation protein RsbU (phosphoserine phosphatase)